MPNNTVLNRIEIFNFSKLIDTDESERFKGGNGKFSFLLRAEKMDMITKLPSTSFHGVNLEI